MARLLSSLTVMAAVAALSRFFGAGISVTSGTGNQRGLTVLDHPRNEAEFANLAEAALVPGTTLEMALLTIESLTSGPGGYIRGSTPLCSSSRALAQQPAACSAR